MTSTRQQWQTNLVSLKTIAYKEIRRFLRIWQQTLLPPAITMTLYLIIFGSLIGARIGEMGGHSYIEFIVPGVIMIAVITNSYANVVSSFFSAKFQRFIEEILVSPTPNLVILLGYLAGGFARGLLVGAIVLAISLLFTELRIHNPWITASIVLLTSLLFALGGFINAIFARTYDDISIIPTFVLTPLTYLGGVFYSIHLLPPFWQKVSLINPILYLVNAFRYGILGHSDINIGIAYTVALAFIALLGSIAMLLLRLGTGLRS
ncbi:MAG: ABC transporter permease [Xanthomonadaceae bacterium]|nr:ABC transporter permease [Xanthomonadaceae bacterium]